MVYHPQNQHRDHRPHRAEGDQSKAVIRRMFVTSNRRNTHTQRHNKGDCHRPCGNTAGIKRHREKVSGDKVRQYKHQPIKSQQHIRKPDSEQHTQKGNYQKTAHPHCHSQNQHHIGHGRHLSCQHLQIRLRNRNDKAKCKADQHHNRQLPAFCHGSAHTPSDGSHGQLRPDRKKQHPHSQ